ncbi:MAG: hypothetical protein M5U28_23100 [Sandaracinaceae bacterium]|nr:hypothetical protein [Sandaracinaceae bacterium]
MANTPVAGGGRPTPHESYFLRLANLPISASRARLLRAMLTLRRAAATGALGHRSLEQAALGYDRLLARLAGGTADDTVYDNRPSRTAGAGTRSRALATGRVLDDRAGGYVTVALAPDGQLECDRVDLLRNADEIHDRVMRGHPHDGRGVAELAALIRALPSLWDHRWACLRASDLGAWRALYVRYETHTLVEAAVRRYADATRDPRRERALEALATCGYRRARRLTMQHSLVGLDLPLSAIDGAVVAMYREELWEVPLAPDWHEAVHAQGLATVCGRFVCARSTELSSVLYVIIEDEPRGFVVAPREYDRRTGTLREARAGRYRA